MNGVRRIGPFEFVISDVPPKPRIRVKAVTRTYGGSIPDDAVPGDLVVGNRGAAGLVVQPVSEFVCDCLVLKYVGNYYEGVRPAPGCKLYDFRGGT